MPKLVRIALLLALTGSFACAQLGSSCDLGAAGIKDVKTFQAFDRELRAALVGHDVVTVTALVTYPLQVSDDRGRYSPTEPAALQSHFREIFPAAIRNAVLDQKPDGFFSTAEGIMDGGGEVWVEVTPVGYAIKNRQRADKLPSSGFEDRVCL
jgi:hypothetical protein